MSRPTHHDEHKQFERATKRNSRPRTKNRPEYADAEMGFVTGVDRGRYTVLVSDGFLPSVAEGVRPAQNHGSSSDDGEMIEFAQAAELASGARTLFAMKARELNRERIVVGDRVLLVGDTTGSPDALARIVKIATRTSVLRRTADDNDPYERVVVANADQLMIVVALADPPPRIGMIDRAVVAAYEAGIDATLVLTKADLGSPSELQSLYESAGVRVIITKPARSVVEERPQVSSRNPQHDDSVGFEMSHSDSSTDGKKNTLPLDPASVAEVLAALRGRVTVFLGHSGVGKSTLVNALVPGAARATGIVNEVTGRGRQTSTSAVALALPTGDGWVIDTPGIRSLGIAHVQTEQVVSAFPDLAIIADEQCPRGCSHLPDAPDCALDEWVSSDVDPEVNAARQQRLESLRRLLTARAAAAESLERHASIMERRAAASAKRKK